MYDTETILISTIVHACNNTIARYRAENAAQCDWSTGKNIFMNSIVKLLFDIDHSLGPHKQ